MPTVCGSATSPQRPFLDLTAACKRSWGKANCIATKVLSPVLAQSNKRAVRRADPTQRGCRFEKLSSRISSSAISARADSSPQRQVESSFQDQTCPRNQNKPGCAVCTATSSMPLHQRITGRSLRSLSPCDESSRRQVASGSDSHPSNAQPLLKGV